MSGAPILSKAGIETSAQLEKEIADLELVDVLRVFTTAGHAILHRSPRPITAEDLTRELVAGVNELHLMGFD